MNIVDVAVIDKMDWDFCYGLVIMRKRPIAKLVKALLVRYWSDDNFQEGGIIPRNPTIITAICNVIK